MTVHFSRFKLNTYAATPYFQALIPPDYPLNLVLISSRSFRRLPPHLRELSTKAKEWACANSPFPAGVDGIEEFYDDGGYELDADTGKRLTDEEIDLEWDKTEKSLPDDFEVEDIQTPLGGFPDPSTWQPTEKVSDELVDRMGLSENDLLDNIKSRGRKLVAEEYGVPDSWRAKDDKDLARMVLDMHGKPWPNAKN